MYNFNYSPKASRVSQTSDTFLRIAFRVVATMKRKTVRRPRKERAAYCSLMFWLTWKKLSGSYFRLISTSRS
jgi:hypothetical protein